MTGQMICDIADKCPPEAIEKVPNCEGRNLHERNACGCCTDSCGYAPAGEGLCIPVEQPADAQPSEVADLVTALRNIEDACTDPLVTYRERANGVYEICRAALAPFDNDEEATR